MERNNKINFKAALTIKNIIAFIAIAGLFAIGIFYLLNYINGTPVPEEEARDKITTQLQSLKLPGTVIHRKSTLYMYDAKGKIFNTTAFEMWEDNDTDKYKNIIDYSDGKVIKSFDGGTEYDYEVKTNTLKKETLIFQEGSTIPDKRGYRTEVINWFNEILNTPDLKAVETTYKSKPVFVVTLIKNTDDKYVHYFDQETLALITTKIYKVKNGKDVLYQENTDELFELITPSSEEERAQYFAFDIEITAATKVTETQIDGVTRKEIE